MSQVKRHLEDLSERLGYGGEINEEVMKAAESEAGDRIDIGYERVRDSGIPFDRLLSFINNSVVPVDQVSALKSIIDSHKTKKDK